MTPTMAFANAVNAPGALGGDLARSGAVRSLCMCSMKRSANLAAAAAEHLAGALR